MMLSVLVMFTGCGKSAESKYDAGYDDGYSVGYNTTLKIRATLVEGDWSNTNYKKGYDEGYRQGVNDAMKKKE